jgi:Holliday junction resolvase RusA-like endonuclease
MMGMSPRELVEKFRVPKHSLLAAMAASGKSGPRKAPQGPPGDMGNPLPLTPAGVELIIMLALPPKECSPNWRGHWAQKAKAVSEYRTAARAATLQAMVASLPRVYLPARTASVQATFRFKTNRRRDRDNLLASLKSALDSLADAGLIVDDSGLAHEPVVIQIEPSRPGVTLRVRLGETT